MPFLTLSAKLWGLLAAIVGMILDVVQFWNHSWVIWMRSRSPKDQLLYDLSEARTFEEWEETAFRLDELISADIWRQNPTSKHYDCRLILQRLESILRAREAEDILTLVSILRSGLVRNLGNITSIKLFNHTFAGTKLLIDDYITHVALSIQYVTSLQTIPMHVSGFTSQAKLELLHDTRQAFGRTTLVLQGGSVFGLCHLGVVKALHLRGLLPRIITGTATGALVAALVGVRTEDELLGFLDGGILELCAGLKEKNHNLNAEDQTNYSYHSNHSKPGRLHRWLVEGNFLDESVLEECVQSWVGDMTFEEAYAKTKRILNITVAAAGKGTFPNLLNYLTAPNVLIRSAALASNASSGTLYCKDESGAIIPWPHTQDVIFRSWRQVNLSGRDSPLARLAELFNVNHFIVSQTRPYIVPFLYPDTHPAQRLSNQATLTQTFMRFVMLEVRHRLKQLDYLGFLPLNLRRLLMDESIPGPSITLVPDLAASDLLKLFQAPSKARLDYWIRQGERGVWPAISALRVRCAIEIELDRCYQMVRRRRRQSDGYQQPYVASQHRHGANEGAPRKRRSIGHESVE